MALGAVRVRILDQVNPDWVRHDSINQSTQRITAREMKSRRLPCRLPRAVLLRPRRARPFLSPRRNCYSVGSSALLAAAPVRRRPVLATGALVDVPVAQMCVWKA
ncbi:hypothetical protein LX36DRAFT_439729 [Colletotrichum falcatum]|nr:hypothetical protein LX36DRAFT_439729 [Colletotrichum falcatum]